MKHNKSRVVVVGAGNVGSTTAYTILNQGLCEELVLIDMNKDKAYAEALDMQHAVYFMGRNAKVWSGDYSDCADADIVIITAAAPMDINADNRLDMLAPTKRVIKSIISSVMGGGFNGVLLVISNPVDIMTYYAWKLSGLPSNQVIGSGTNLDMARLSCRIADLFDLDARNISCFIVGEHGDSEVVCWNNATIGAKSLSKVMEDNLDRAGDVTKEELRQYTTAAGWDIFHKKGNTSYGIAASAASIVRTILFNENRILPVTTLFEGQYGLSDVYLSSPVVLGGEGVKEIVEVNLSDEEHAALRHSADVVLEFYDALQD